MVGERCLKKQQGPDRASCLLLSPIFSTEGISLLLCREDSWATRFFLHPIQPWIKSSSSCQELKLVASEQPLWRGVDPAFAAGLVTFSEGKIYSPKFSHKELYWKGNGGLKVFTVKDQNFWVVSAKIKGEKIMWKSQNTLFQHFFKMRFILFENLFISRKT